MNDPAQMIRPVRFRCEETLKVPRREIFDGLIRLENWTSFVGFGPLPGIREAVYVQWNEGVTGSVIRVENTDGSVHQERILEWLPEEQAVIELSKFSPPLSAVASRFVEVWSFVDVGGNCRVRRDFELYPVSKSALPLLWGISLLLRLAVGRHLKSLAAGVAL